MNSIDDEDTFYEKSANKEKAQGRNNTHDSNKINKQVNINATADFGNETDDKQYKDIKKTKRFLEVEKRFNELREDVDNEGELECRKAVVLSKLLNYEMNMHWFDNI